MTRAAASLALAALLSPIASPSSAQESSDVVEVAEPEGGSRRVRVRRDHGFAAAWVGALTAWGWEVDARGDSALAVHASGRRLLLRAGIPFVDRGADLVQLADSPFLADQALYVPIQVLSELGAPARGISAADRGAPGTGATPIIVIDAGHGGRDLGTIGHGGSREKDIALGVARLLARRLEAAAYEVVLTRDRDVFIPVWERGRIATARKGDAPGVLISLHVNANARSRDVRGLETYFLAEARTEHERRLAELESRDPGDGADGTLPPEDLSHILSELRNLDYQRWSARLADVVHRHVAEVHPGPDLGVRQAPLAVLTNALMPAVLVEIGYITNGPEEALLSRGEFQADVASALAQAVEAFLGAYPPALERRDLGREE